MNNVCILLYIKTFIINELIPKKVKHTTNLTRKAEQDVDKKSFTVVKIQNLSIKLKIYNVYNGT